MTVAIQQPGLFDSFTKVRHYSCTELGFQSFDIDHPEIWREFERITLTFISDGRRHGSAKAVFEIMRYNSSVYGKDGFKLNNSWTRFYSDKFARQHSEHKDFFEHRIGR